MITCVVNYIYVFQYTDPQTWSKDDLQKWILSLKKKYSYKAWFEKVQPERYANWTGKVICAISREIFLAFEKGMAGEFMFEDLHKRRRSELWK